MQQSSLRTAQLLYAHLALPGIKNKAQTRSIRLFFAVLLASGTDAIVLHDHLDTSSMIMPRPLTKHAYQSLNHVSIGAFNQIVGEGSSLARSNSDVTSRRVTAALPL